MQIYQLTYHSICSPHISAGELKDILSSALEFNAAHNITGCLVKYRSEFVQILEGDEDMVKRLFQKIKSDYRHNSVSLLATSFADKRQYPNWSMGFYNLRSEEVQIIGKTSGAKFNLKNHFCNSIIDQAFMNITESLERTV